MYPIFVYRFNIFCINSHLFIIMVPDSKQGVLYFLVQFCESYGRRLFYNRRTRTVKDDYTNNDDENDANLK